MTDRGIETRSVRAGERADPATGACATPIYQTTSYEFPDAETAAARYALSSPGDVYSRISNPTVQTLEHRLAALEGGAGAVATATGMAALDALTFVLAGSGSNIVSSSALYGGTTTYFSTIARRRSIEARFVDPLDYQAYADAIDDRTAYVHVETIGNPSLVTPDLERLADIAHDNAVPFVVDNTFATPFLCRPLEHGADIVWESTTKWLHGGGTTLGGVIIDGGTFDWDSDRHEEIAGPNPAYDGVDFTRDFEDAPVAAAIRFRSLRSLGATQTPFNAWQTLQGLSSFPARMAKHCEHAHTVAEFLTEHDAVDWVSYPGLDSHPTHETAARYLEGGFGGVVTFGLRGGFAAGKRFCEETELASFLANVGDARTLVIHPASTTHGQLSEAERADSGVKPDLIRLSVGLETPTDLLADIDRAIEIATTDYEKQ